MGDDDDEHVNIIQQRNVAGMNGIVSSKKNHNSVRMYKIQLNQSVIFIKSREDRIFRPVSQF